MKAMNKPTSNINKFPWWQQPWFLYGLVPYLLAAILGVLGYFVGAIFSKTYAEPIGLAAFIIVMLVWVWSRHKSVNMNEFNLRRYAAALFGSIGTLYVLVCITPHIAGALIIVFESVLAASIVVLLVLMV